jgi:hypothetical protein
LLLQPERTDASNTVIAIIENSYLPFMILPLFVGYDSFNMIKKHLSAGNVSKKLNI